MIDTEREQSGTRRVRTLAMVAYALLVVAVAGLVASSIVVRFTRGVAYHHPPLMKDPERTIPPGNTIVLPADGTVLYVRRIENGVIPEVVKRTTGTLSSFSEMPASKPGLFISFRSEAGEDPF